MGKHDHIAQRQDRQCGASFDGRQCGFIFITHGPNPFVAASMTRLGLRSHRHLTCASRLMLVYHICMRLVDFKSDSTKSEQISAIFTTKHIGGKDT